MKGTLKRFRQRKNTAPVPRNSIFGSRIASKYRIITGPAALATSVVKPASTPAVMVNHAGAVAAQSSGSGRVLPVSATLAEPDHFRQTCSRNMATTMPPISRRVAASLS